MKMRYLLICNDDRGMIKERYNEKKSLLKHVGYSL